MSHQITQPRIATVLLLAIYVMACDSTDFSGSGVRVTATASSTVLTETTGFSTEQEEVEEQTVTNVPEDNQQPESATTPVDAEAARVKNFCPAYEDSALYRSRANTIVISPDDSNWELKIENAQANTEILLMDGEYLFDYGSIFMQEPDITVRSLSGDRDSVRIRGLGFYQGSNEGFMIAADRITIADLTMHDIRRHAIAMKPGFDEDAILDQTYIYNMNLYDIGTQQIKGADSGENRDAVVACSRIGYTESAVRGDYIGAIGIFEGSDVIVRDNYIYNITGDGTGCNVAAPQEPCNYDTVPAIYMRVSRDSIIERNIVVDSWRAISLGLTNGHVRGIIRNNYIYREGPGDMGISVERSIDTIVEHNTVFVGEYFAPIQVRAGSGHIFRNNLTNAPIHTRDGATNISIEGNGNIDFATVNQLLSPRNPHLKADSYAIGAGVSPATVTEDIDGQRRINSWDVGADQFYE